MEDLYNNTAEVDPIQLVMGIIKKNKWEHLQQDDFEVTILQVGKHAHYLTHVEDMEDDVNMITMMDFDCPGYAELELYRLLNLINHAVSPGTFLYDKSNKKISYKTTIDYNDERVLTSEQIERRVREMTDVMDACYPCIECVAGRTAEPKVSGVNGITCLDPGMTALDAFDLFNDGSAGHA